jgi:hypothetical protein
MPLPASDEPAVAALGRTLAFIARPDFRLRDVLQHGDHRLRRAGVHRRPVHMKQARGCHEPVISATLRVRVSARPGRHSV